MMCLRRYLVSALFVLLALPAQAADGAVQPRAETTSFCYGVVLAAGQVFAIRQPLFMTRPEADLVIAMPDAGARALAIASDDQRRTEGIDPEILAAARKSGGTALTRLLSQDGFDGADYRALRDTCRALGDTLHATMASDAIDRAYAAAAPLAARYRD